MAIIPVLSFLLVLFIKLSVSKSSNNENELILVSVIFRHGARTPISFYPTDPNKNEEFYPIGFGGLTNKGKMQEMNLGRFLRQQYNEFLGNYYTEDKVYIRSTGVNRCKMSAQLVLAGLFPPRDEQIWNPLLDWQPIPVEYKDEMEEDLLHPEINCPYKLKVFLQSFFDSEIRKIYVDPYIEIYNYIQNYSKMLMFEPGNILSFTAIIESETKMDLIIPDWAYQIYPEPLRSIAGVMYSFHNYDLLVKQVNAGFLLKKIIDDSMRKINGKDLERKIYLYSGHETTVGYMLDALNMFQSHVPQYSTALLFELHKFNSEFFIKIRYRNETSAEEPVDMLIPGCGYLCPIESFIALYDSIIPKKTIQEICEL